MNPGAARSRLEAYGLFSAMCVIWGLTWIPIKIGVTAMPPQLFAALRFSAAGILLLAIARFRRASSIRRADWPRLAAVSFLLITVTYALLFWGMTVVPSGLAAVVNLALVPISLLLVGVLFQEDTLTPLQLAGALGGAGGLLLLFRDALGLPTDATPLAGLAAVAGSTIAFSVGTVAGRGLLRTYGALALGGWTNTLGSLGLFGLSLASEPGSPAAAARLLRPAVLASWIALVLFGSAIALSIFLRLTRDWSASRAGLYAFVSPVIAVLAGAAFLGERFERADLVAMVLMLAAALAVLRGRGTAAGTPSTPPRLPLERVRHL